MRIYRRAEFLKLPAGTMFSKSAGAAWIFGYLSVKDESLTNDFYCCDLNWIDAHDSGEALERLELMLNAGASFPVQNSDSRDALFNDSDMFLVWERADLETLMGHVVRAMAVAPDANAGKVGD